MNILVIIEQIGILAVLTLIGLIAFKFKIINEPIKKGMVNL